MWVEYEDGARLSRSAKKPGSFSPLTREGGTNNLGHVTLDPIDGDERLHSGPGERSEFEEFLRDVAVDVTLILLEKARPHVEKWVVETAAPAVGSAAVTAGSAVGSAAVTAGSAVGSAVASASSAVGSAAVTAGSAVGSAAVTAGSAVGSVVASAGSAVGSAAVTASSAVGSAAVTASSAVGSAAATAGSAVGSAAVAAGSAAGSTVSSAWNRVTRKKRKRVVAVEAHVEAQPAPVEAAAVEAAPMEVAAVAAPADASDDVVGAIEAYRAGMSREEARQRIVAALAARLFSEQQIAIVRDARIEDDGDSAELALTQQQIGDSVRLMLESTPALRGENAMADLRSILSHGPAEGGQLEQRM
ncbi:hypothetical protein [Actinoplanes sp. URMC 104]|uniref:hypothetical protein n=1 Tax=Actinoplanes sp. URMC 104 TaxID=3423409 RepID=UPI003F530E88